MLVADQLVGVAVVPLNVTVLVPCVAPKFVPVIVTDVPTGPLVGDRLVTVGGDRHGERAAPLLATPPTVTTTLPVVAPAGTGDHDARRRPARRRRRRPVERHRARALASRRSSCR